MSAKLPVFVDPVHYARLGIRCEGPLAIGGMKRLALELPVACEPFHVRLAFEMQGKTPVIKGHISGQMQLRCQRCLELMPLDVNHEFTLAVVSSEQEAAQLAEEVEPLMITEKDVSVSELIEDELIILLPDVPAHPEGACELAYRAEPEPEQESEKKENPFRLLQGLKN